MKKIAAIITAGLATLAISVTAFAASLKIGRAHV